MPPGVWGVGGVLPRDGGGRECHHHYPGGGILHQWSRGDGAVHSQTASHVSLTTVTRKQIFAPN